MNGVYIRDEEQQATYLLDLLEIFKGEKIDSVFVNTFARYDLPHRHDPIFDLDLASGGVVKVYENNWGKTCPDMHWEPKAAFFALAEYFKRKSK